MRVRGAPALGRTLAAVAATPEQASAAVDAFCHRHGWQPLVAAAKWHGITGCLWLATRSGNLGEQPDVATLVSDYQDSLIRHLRTLGDLTTVERALHRASLSYAVLKGPVLAEVVYDRPDLRSYVDLDLIVAPSDFAAVLDALEEVGCESLDRNWTLMKAMKVGQIRLASPSGGLIDLHWHLLNESMLRAEFDLGRNQWAHRLRTVQVGSTAVSTLDSEMTLVHLGVHAAISGGHRLTWLKDIQQAVRGHVVDWSVVCDRARDTAAGLPLALMLYRARRFLGVEIPPWVLLQLCPDRLWRRVIQSADLMAPVSRVQATGSVAQLVARSSRSNGRASRTELVRRATSWAKHPHGTRERMLQRLFDRDYPGSLSYDSGGAYGRQEYLALVTAQD